ncbi:MAG: 4Fe-4S dicluster domain-containing protein [Peptococcaceae bacterium]|nr:4Fe-4S dicluster domain-containing protein [Peptococcaceae bacterium]
MRYGMVIDLDRCIGCQTCMVSCHMHNSQPPGIWWNRVFTQGGETHQDTVIDSKDEYRMDYLPVSCQMCDKPSCQSVCPTGATYTDENGVVLVDYKRCIGCRLCMTACPYSVRQFNWQDAKKAKKEFGYEYGYPFDVNDGKNDKKLVYTRHRRLGVAEKCTFCIQYISDNKQPICVQACSAKARFFGDLDATNSDVSKLVKSKKFSRRLLEDKGTKPKVYYVSSKETAIKEGKG